MFGELTASYDNVFPVGLGSVDKVSLSHSFFGVKGVNEISNKVSLIYQLTWGVHSNGLDTEKVTGFENKNQVIGLASRTGAVILGRYDTPFKVLGKKSDLFWHSQLGQNRNVTNAKDWDLRADKIIVVQTPTKKGFQGSFAYSPDISDTSRITQNGSAISLNGFYKKGKFQYGAAFESHDLKPSATQTAAETNALRLNVVYKDGPLKVVGFYQQENNDVDQTAIVDASVIGVGVAYKKDKGVLKAQLYSRDNENSVADSHLFALGYDYKYDKNFDFFAQAVKITNTTGIGGNSFMENSTSVSRDAHGLSLGVRYKF